MVRSKADMCKYTVRIRYDVKGWAYFRRAEALERYAPDDFEVTKGPDYKEAVATKHHDLVMQLPFSYINKIRQHIDTNGYDMLLVAGFNIGWGYANHWFPPVYRSSDHVIINSRECWERLGRLPNSTWISNGVDREVYRLAVPPEKRKPKVIWIGSRFHAKTKGYGKILRPLADRLRELGIQSDFRLVDSDGEGRLNARQITDWYNTGTVYVVASKTEGTPNPALEAASAGCVIVATRVGNMPELIEHGVNGELVDRNVDSLLAAVLRCQDRYVEMAEAMQERIEPWHWRHRAKQYFDLFRRLIDKCHHH